jgi:hypothetical protein
MAVWLRVTVGMLGLLFVSPASAWAQGEFGVDIRYSIRPDGGGSLVANPVPGGQGSISWARCADGGDVCEPVSAGPNDRLLEVGDAPLGSVFEATATHDGQTASARSLPYQGAVSALNPPGVVGRLRVGALVRPTAADWTGGWGREFSFLQTQACSSPGGGSCLVIADQYYWNRCPGAGAVLDARFEGWYVRVIDRRTGDGVVFPGFAVLRPEVLKPIEPSQAAAAGTFGPIAPADAPPESTCGRPDPFPVLQAPPAATESGPGATVTLLRKGKTRRGIVLGWARCPDACTVHLAARRRTRMVGTSRRIAAGKRHSLLLPKRRIARLGGRRVRVAVHVDRHRLAARTVTLPRRR